MSFSTFLATDLAEFKLDELNRIAHRDGQWTAFDEEVNDGVDLLGQVTAEAFPIRRGVVSDEL